MLFTEPLFFAFFAVVFAVHWSLGRNRQRKVLLLAASYFFYAAWDWRFCGLILTSTGIDYFVGLRLRDTNAPRARRFWVTVSICANLGLLGVFKYFGFFVESANSIFGWFGIGAIRELQIILPVGISFYTFQTMSYSIDAYRRRIEPCDNFADFALFVSFFPQLVMGPILRGASFLPQLAESKRVREVPFKSLLTLFLVGFIKKSCISDNIAPLVDAFYGEPGAYDALATSTVLVFYAVQLYCDFSGYTDMAIAVAGLLGYEVKRNFDFPFFATNVTDFWRRWHISFSSWLRDYLYFPLGGSRRGGSRTLVNLMLTMLLSGLWHGAGWTFITWGGLNGLALGVHRYYGQLRVPAWTQRLFAGLGWPLTFGWFVFTLIFFRAENFAAAVTVISNLAAIGSNADPNFDLRLAWWFVPLGVAHWASWRRNPTELAARVPAPLFAVLLGLAMALAMSFVQVEYRPFIYFQF